MKVLYPGDLEERVLKNESPCGPPAEISLVIPTITEPGKSFCIRVALLDKDGFAASVPEGGMQISIDLCDGKIIIPFAHGRLALAEVHEVSLPEEGIFRFSASLNGCLYYSNPTSCKKGGRPGIYWGDPHIHTVLSHCHADLCRTLNYCYVCGRYVSALDFVAAADHVSNGRCDFSKWKEQCTVRALYDRPGAFVALPAYEASFKGGSGGDNNIYMTVPVSMYEDGYEEGTVKTVCEALKLQADSEGFDFFAVPHHTSRVNKHGEISKEIYPGPEMMPVVEIASKWGRSEYRGNPCPLLKVHEGPSFAQDLLNSGYVMGFIGGSDSHQSMTYIKDEINPHLYAPSGITAVFADTLTVEEIFGGIKKRHCYAAVLERIYLDVCIAGAGMGELIENTDPRLPRSIEVTAAAKSDIESIEIIRNASCIHTFHPQRFHASFTFTDTTPLSSDTYYYIRVTCSSGAAAWSSPVFFRFL